ncbi:hypothetical protein ACIPQH_25275 [Streptomyces rubiginosohelvolus]|uniref:hypothetical protein n=1 Tax=Streptomyces rubiginosohelvolus TaxID=67362 RepID=UPI003821B8C4
MSHGSDDGSGRQKKGTKLTPGTRKVLAVVGIFLAGGALSAGIAYEAMSPEKATALATVAGVTVSAAALTARRSGDR